MDHQTEFRLKDPVSSNDIQTPQFIETRKKKDLYLAETPFPS